MYIFVIVALQSTTLCIGGEFLTTCLPRGVKKYKIIVYNGSSLVSVSRTHFDNDINC